VLPTIGIAGGGQLARMLLPAASRLALPVVLLAAPDDAAAPYCAELIDGEPDADGLRALAARCDVLTVEHELVDLATMRALADEGHAVRPSAAALAVANDKVKQRELLEPLGVPVAPWILTDDLDEVATFADEHGWELVLKRPAGGYDGRGVFVVAGRDAAAAVLDEVGGPVLVEPKLPLQLEVAALVGRREDGVHVTYPPVRTVQEGAMCREVHLPAPIDASLATRARELAVTVAGGIGSVGILAVELFVVDGQLLLNELAARPHNAGHVTIEGAVTDQFENHLRAVADLPLGTTDARAPAVMVNVVGARSDPRDHLADVLQDGEVAVHLYGKGFRPGRKLGHVTVVGPDLDEAGKRARRAAAALSGGSE
jgi:5-(carboxyamino)imidazole ribonucleotide synthase